MSGQYCKYHPLEPALWYSSRRHMAFCERCVESSETLGGYGQARCLVSGEELDYLGSANLPFSVSRCTRMDCWCWLPLRR